jgi:hypothetical protein
MIAAQRLSKGFAKNPLILFLVLLLCCGGSFKSVAQDLSGLASLLRGASILAQDSENTFLGKVDNEFSSESIFNEFGTYGSKFSSSSIWNEFSSFGSEFSSYSAFSEFSSTPPMLVKNGRVIGYLTQNKFLRGGISPNILRALKDEY